MGDILDFPSQHMQGMAFLERQLCELMTRKGADEHLIEFATDQLQRLYSRINTSEQYSFSVNLPDGLDIEEREALRAQINAGLEGIRKENHALLLEMVAQLVLAEVRLFQHERAD
jgi:hypothetical protein